MENGKKINKEKLTLKARKVKMLILDVDGVMTDGRIIYDNKGNELKCFNVLDGMGLALLYQAGIKVALITAKGSKAVLRRAADIGAVEVEQNAVEKLTPFQQILQRHNLTAEDVCFMGDDLVDMPIMKRAGLAVAVPNACAEVKQSAHYVTGKEGGRGAVREVIEIILRAQNKWAGLIKKFLICIACLMITAGCAQKAEQDLEEEQSAQSAEEAEGDGEEMLSNFSVSGYAQGGQRQWDMEGRSANIMDEEIALKDVTGKVYGEQSNMTVVADRGTLNRIDSNVHLEKNVLATSDDGASLSTDSLDWDAQNQKLTSDAPVCITKGGMEAFGTGIIAQPVLNLVELNKDVTVKINLDDKNAAGDISSGESAPADGQKTEPALPTVITCTGSLKVDYQNNVAFFQDNVQAKDTRGQIFAHQMDVYFTSKAKKEGEKTKGMQDLGIEKIVALGSVEIHHGPNITYSEKAVYDAASGKLTLTGRPKLVIYSTEDLGRLMGGE